MDLLSVIIPMYNSAKYINRCLKSVIEQTYTELEIIVIDDGSIDNGYEIVYNMSINDKRIKLLRQENCGVSAARNRGLSIMTGKYVTFLDADDWLDVDTYNSQMKCFDMDDVDIAIGGFIRQFEDKSIKVLSKGEYTVLDSQNAIIEMFSCKLFRGEVCDKIYRRELIDTMRFDEEIAVAEDLLMNWSVFHKARKISYKPIWGYHYEVNVLSVTNKYSLKNFSQIAALEIMMNQYNDEIELHKVLKGVYGRGLASNILRMLLSSADKYSTVIHEAQRKLRKEFFSSITAPRLSIRQRLAIVYGILPYEICKGLAGIAKKGQKNM